MKKYILILFSVFAFGQSGLIARQNFGKKHGNALPVSLSYYRLDSNADDYKSTNNGSTISVTYGAGKINNCVITTGTSSGVSFGAYSALNLNTGTICGWVKTTSPGASYRVVFAKLLAYGVFLVDGVLGIYDWGGSAFRSTGVDLRDGNWHHVAFVFESGTSTNYIYIDGTLSLTTSMTVSSQGDALYFGRSFNSQYLNGSLDGIAIFNYKLSGSEILAVYNAGLAGIDLN